MSVDRLTIDAIDIGPSSIVRCQCLRLCRLFVFRLCRLFVFVCVDCLRFGVSRFDLFLRLFSLWFVFAFALVLDRAHFLFLKSQLLFNWFNSWINWLN